MGIEIVLVHYWIFFLYFFIKSRDTETVDNTWFIDCVQFTNHSTRGQSLFFFFLFNPKRTYKVLILTLHWISDT